MITILLCVDRRHILWFSQWWSTPISLRKQWNKKRRDLGSWLGKGMLLIMLFYRFILLFYGWDNLELNKTLYWLISYSLQTKNEILVKLEDEIRTLKSVLSTKERQAAELKRKLGITPIMELKQDITHSIQAIKESDTYVTRSSSFLWKCCHQNVLCMC